ncbi:hypothetical protein LCGC14_1721830 [marine sediment metagenome]|uniref:Uncharacterized protein n=1 Tax=marine sediment metagenome TaxID=412755 RepID=A0A0F9KBW7_9ZZZZ
MYIYFKDGINQNRGARMKRDNLHLVMLLIGLGFFLYLTNVEYVNSKNYLFPMGINVGLAIQYFIDDYYANKDKTLRGKNDN